MTVVVEGINGLGDNLYQRPLVKLLAKRDDVYIRTPWPELYADIPRVRFLKMATILRTQSENVERTPAGVWSQYPTGARVIEPRYGTNSVVEGLSLIESFAKAFGLQGVEREYDLPPLPASPINVELPIAIVRPVTLRSEWYNPARNPLAMYVNEIARELMKTHFVISLAYLRQGHEWIVGEAPPCHLDLHHGELNSLQMLALVKAARVAVGGVGWILPASIYARTPVYVVLGGQGGLNSPDFITSPDMPLSRVGWATPTNYCHCIDKSHKCDKTISENLDAFKKWHEAL